MGAYLLEMFQQVTQMPNAAVKRTYTTTLNARPVADAAMLPTFDSMRSSAYRYVELSICIFKPTFVVRSID
jgi:hypothetical protein